MYFCITLFLCHFFIYILQKLFFCCAMNEYKVLAMVKCLAKLKVTKENLNLPITFLNIMFLHV